jgi:hypothetical protein
MVNSINDESYFNPWLRLLMAARAHQRLDVAQYSRMTCLRHARHSVKFLCGMAIYTHKQSVKSTVEDFRYMRIESKPIRNRVHNHPAFDTLRYQVEQMWIKQRFTHAD